MLHIAIGKFLANDHPQFMSTLSEQNVTVIGVMDGTSLESMASDPPDVVILGEQTAMFVPHFRQTLEHIGRRCTPVIAGTITAGASSHTPSVGQSFDDSIDVTRPREEVVSKLADIINTSRQLCLEKEASPRGNRNKGIYIDLRDDIDRQIVEHVAQGLSDREISGALFLAEHTVRNRLSRLMTRSDITNRTHLALIHHQQRAHEIMDRLQHMSARDASLSNVRSNNA